MIPFVERAVHVSKSDTARELPAAILRYAASLVAARELIVIGDSAPGGDAFFGMVEDADRDIRGAILILDSRQNQVSVFDAHGAFLHRFGGAGDGPHEFRAPEGIEIVSSGSAVVADRHRRLKVFDFVDSSYEHTATLLVDFVPEELCAIGDDLYIQASKPDSTIIHHVTLGGTTRRSFGHGYLTSNLLVLNQLSDGPIGCSEDASVVVTMMKMLPYVFGYRIDGSIAWVTNLDDFETLPITETVNDGRPAITFGPIEAEYHAGLGIVGLDSQYVLVQVGVHDPESARARAAYARIDSYLLSATDGRGLYLGTGLPPVLRSIAGTMIAGSNEPLPQVEILEYDQ